MTVVKASESAPDVNEGVYPATLTGYEIDHAGTYGPQVKAVWTLQNERDSKGAPKEKWQFLSLKLTPRTNLWAFFKSLGVPLQVGGEYDIEEMLDPLVGTKRSLLIKHVDGEKGVSAKITEILPGGSGHVTNPPAAATAPSAGTGDICAVVGCEDGVDKYTGGGLPLCARHTAADL